MLDTSKVEFEVHHPDINQPRVSGSVRIYTDKFAAADILGYMRSGSFKRDIDRRWAAKEAPGYSVNLVGGPRPVFQEDGNRETPVIAYEHDIDLVQWV